MKIATRTILIAALTTLSLFQTACGPSKNESTNLQKGGPQVAATTTAKFNVLFHGSFTFIVHQDDSTVEVLAARVDGPKGLEHAYKAGNSTQPGPMPTGSWSLKFPAGFQPGDAKSDANLAPFSSGVAVVDATAIGLQRSSVAPYSEVTLPFPQRVLLLRPVSLKNPAGVWFTGASVTNPKPAQQAEVLVFQYDVDPTGISAPAEVIWNKGGNFHLYAEPDKSGGDPGMHVAHITASVKALFNNKLDLTFKPVLTVQTNILTAVPVPSISASDLLSLAEMPPPDCKPVPPETKCRKVDVNTFCDGRAVIIIKPRPK